MHEAGRGEALVEHMGLVWLVLRLRLRGELKEIEDMTGDGRVRCGVALVLVSCAH